MKVLLVDNNCEILDDKSMLINSLGYDCITAVDGRQAIGVIRKQCPDVILTDLQMPYFNGLDVLEEAKKVNSDVPVIIFTGHGSVQSSVIAMKNGAFDYIEKPFLPEHVEKVLEEVKAKIEASSNYKYDGATAETLEGVIYKSKVMKKVASRVRQVAKSDINVMICGESGTGKEQIARNIHRLSKRKDKSFIPLDCVSIPTTLLESELFGFEKGAFTGAVHSKPGVFELAEGGTLFLDEISELDVSLQAKLLRVIQERQIRRIGGIKQVDVDVRIISASNKNLKESIEKGELRDDLYYRLHVVPIYLPPLRQKKEDIPLLVDYFIKKYRRFSHIEIESVSEEAMEGLNLYDWPGNIRQLENTIQRIISMVNHPVIELSDIPEDIIQFKKVILKESDLEMSFKEIKKEYLSDLEKQYCLKILRKCNGNITKASKKADVSRATFYKMIT